MNSTALQQPQPLDLSSLDAQRDAYSRRRFLAMPLAGTLAWALVGLAGLFASPGVATLVLYIATGSIFYLGMLISRLTGENFGASFGKGKPKNAFDSLFLMTVAMALLVYAIAIPFAMQDRSSLPLSIGILTGLMWLPFSWMARHWIGIVHAVSRTLLILVCWYAFPDQRLTAIPAVIVVVYLFTIVVLERRWQGTTRASV